MVTSYHFQDEFTGLAGSAPDPTKWGHSVGSAAEIGGNNELGYYRNSRANSFLDGQGHLVIRATREGGTYYTARLDTLGKFSQYHGTWEARIKINSQAGAWPAWWLMGVEHEYPMCGEVDILENYGTPGGTSYGETTVWTPNTRGSDMTHSKAQSFPMDNNWHVYRTWWNASTGNFQFYRDATGGTPYLTVKPTDLPNWCYSGGNPLYMILMLDVGGSSGGDPSGTAFPVDLLCDYVRVWGGISS